MVSLGLKDAGYTYMNIDDCWSLAQRDSNNHIQADPAKFPSGMASLGNQLHAWGLNFGIFSAAGTKSCESGAGSLTFEQYDAADFASWGVDYLKYGDCNGLGIPKSTRFASMRDALNKTGRPIFYSLAKGDLSDIASTGSSISNAWRTSLKVLDAWENVRTSFQVNNYYAASQATGWYNDPDLLAVGERQLSSQEERSQFALWAIAKAPLLISADLT